MIRMNPVLEKEMKRNMRSIKSSWVIFGVNMVLGIVGVLTFFGSGGKETYLTAGQYRFPIRSYIMIAYVLFAMICLLVPGIAGASIAIERERKTLDLLLLTYLSPWRIIMGKLEASLGMILLITISAMPILSLIMIFGGISVLDLCTLILIMVLSGIFIGSISVFCSVVCNKTTVAVIVSYVITIFLTIGMLIVFYWAYSILSMNSVYTENSTIPQFGPWIYLLYFNPLVVFYGLLSKQTGNGYELIKICNYFGDYTNNFGVEHIVSISIFVQLFISGGLLYFAGKFINTRKK